MKTYAIVIRDTVANVHTQPVFTNSLGGAIREFGDRCKKKDGDLVGMHPDHFELWTIGTYDDETGTMEPGERKQLAVGANYAN